MRGCEKFALLYLNFPACCLMICKDLFSALCFHFLSICQSRTLNHYELQGVMDGLDTDFHLLSRMLKAARRSTGSFSIVASIRMRWRTFFTLQLGH